MERRLHTATMAEKLGEHIEAVLYGFLLIHIEGVLYLPELYPSGSKVPTSMRRCGDAWYHGYIKGRSYFLLSLHDSEGSLKGFSEYQE